MIGLFGIVGNREFFEEKVKEQAFLRMVENAENRDFFVQNTIKGNGFAVGMISRRGRENKDLALKQVGKGIVIGFVGYGKLKGENRLCWAEEMIDRVVPLYQDQGEDALTQIQGSFVCFIVQNNRFVIVSDRFSSKNLFYHQSDKEFVFAPDVGRVIESEFAPREKDLDAAKQVLVSGFFLDDRTLARGVRRFPYASLLEGVVAFPLKVKLRRYWDVPETEGTIDKITPDLVSEFRDTMERAIYELADIEDRAIVPLSGGLDSRAIACYVSKRQSLDTLTYDLGEEVSISKRVCKALNGSRTYFPNEMIRRKDFKLRLRQMVEDERIHAVVNQYFYAPLFRNYFNENSAKVALYDGIYMDILFSAPYTYSRFGIEDFIRVYGRGFNLLGFFSKRLNRNDLRRLIEETYRGVQNSFHHGDGFGRSQKAYLTGRLRRYVLEFLSFKEDYCYVFKPGFDYDLMDFGYSLSLRLRKGFLYRELFKTFPEVANIPYKDSYGNRPKILIEKLKDNYVWLRFKVSYGTNGFFPYFPYQTEWFFLGLNQIDEYREMFLKPNCVDEFFEDYELEALFEQVKRKHYLLNLFQRVLFLQQFYRRYGFYLH